MPQTSQRGGGQGSVSQEENPALQEGMRRAASYRAWQCSPLRLFLLIVLAVLHRRLEIANSFPEPLAQIRQLARTEDQQGNNQNHQEFGQTQFA